MTLKAVIMSIIVKFKMRIYFADVDRLLRIVAGRRPGSLSETKVIGLTHDTLFVRGRKAPALARNVLRCVDLDELNGSFGKGRLGHDTKSGGVLVSHMREIGPRVWG